MSTSYDQVFYKGAPFAQTHPDRLAMLGHLYGMQPANVEHCRVLELGCTDGGNLIPMALALPGSRFLGLDLSTRAVSAGAATIRRLGLTNIELVAGDIMSVDSKWGEFDFIISHGVFSWVPAAVRTQILQISKHNLAPQGIAYISYNAQPGGHLRAMVRDMMLFHVRSISDPVERVTRARELVEFLVAHTPDSIDDYRGFLRKELEGILERDPNVLFHDELSDIWTPLFFHEFAAEAAAHGLQFLSEANYSDMQDRAFDDSAAATLDAWAGDRVTREQYRDFLKCRRFRQTLLCHREVQLNAEPEGGALRTLYASSSAKVVAAEGEVKTFEGARGSSVKTAHAVVVRILENLIAAWPSALHFDELSERVGEEHGLAQADILLALFAAGLVQMHVWRPEMETACGEYPRASALTRLQAEEGAALTTLRHTCIDAKGQLERRLIALLDGTHDRAALERELRPLSPESSAEIFREEVAANLAKAAYLGLLTR